MFKGFKCIQVFQKLQVLQEVQFKNILFFITNIKKITDFTRVIVSKYSLIYYNYYKNYTFTGFTCL